MKLLQPGYFKDFHCIGPACEDTCCAGWIVHIDKDTYGKYQSCSDPEIGSSLHSLITINEKRSNNDDYAQVSLDGSVCPFLSEGLCAIQARLGEEYLSNMCATYPRVVNRVDDMWQRSLDLSCPEAARVVLLNPAPLEFQEEEGSLRPGNTPAIDTSGLKECPEPYRVFSEIRSRAISLLQDRSHPIGKRLCMLGELCGAGPEPVTESANPADQLEIVLDLIVARISSDSNPRRFLECYQEFMNGLEWTTQSTMDEIASRYGQACSQYYLPFMRRHEHILENHLVNYVHRTLFPLGTPESNQRLHNDRVPSPIAAQYMLLVAYYAITRSLLIGMAGFHKSAFAVGHVIKAIQSCTKTFEHSVTYPGRAIEILAEKKMTTAASLSFLF